MSEQPQPVSEFKSKSGVKRIFSALFYSIDGLRTAWTQEHAFRQELLVVVPGVIVALLLPVRAVLGEPPQHLLMQSTTSKRISSLKNSLIFSRL